MWSVPGQRVSGLSVLLFACFWMAGPISADDLLTRINPWTKSGCIPELIKENDHYICARNGSILCLPGWSEVYNLCRTPVCNPPCVTHQGNCTAPNTCTCELGWYGQDCSKCVCLPGCVNGTCIKPFECRCREGWTGLYCDKPICREGCLHGTCTEPGECICHPGWTGPNCTECVTLPDCLNGYCDKPLECKCHEGYQGQFCHKPICREGCDKTNGFCTEPGECWCRPGFTGPTCTECQPYPGCDNGFCEGPWECICEDGFEGKLCNRPVSAANSGNRFVQQRSAPPGRRPVQLPPQLRPRPQQGNQRPPRPQRPPQRPLPLPDLNNLDFEGVRG